MHLTDAAVIIGILLIVLIVAFVLHNRRTRARRNPPPPMRGLSGGEEPAWDNSRQTLTLSSGKQSQWDEAPALAADDTVDLENGSDNESSTSM